MTPNSGLFISSSDHIKKKAQKKAMVATWDDSETESKEKVDTANICFMANRDEVSKVTFESSLDEDDLTMDELERFFKELQEQYENFKISK